MYEYVKQISCMNKSTNYDEQSLTIVEYKIKFVTTFCNLFLGSIGVNSLPMDP